MYIQTFIYINTSTDLICLLGGQQNDNDWQQF